MWSGPEWLGRGADWRMEELGEQKRFQRLEKVGREYVNMKSITSSVERRCREKICRWVEKKKRQKGKERNME